MYCFFPEGVNLLEAIVAVLVGRGYSLDSATSMLGTAIAHVQVKGKPIRWTIGPPKRGPYRQRHDLFITLHP
jgi:hypothetical protein